MKYNSGSARVYAATFIIAFASLVIEITLTRLLSVVTYYGLAYFAVSTAMLGMTAGAVTVYLCPSKFSPENLARSLAKASLNFAISAPIAVLLICTIPLNLDFSDFLTMKSFADFPTMKVLCLLLIACACALPFYFSGIVMSCVLTKVELPITSLYAADLIGAAFGCIFVLAGLEFFDAPSLIIAVGAPAVVAAFLYDWEHISPRMKKLGVALFVILVAGSMINHFTLNGIRPLLVKGNPESIQNTLIERWNSHSRVMVRKGMAFEPQLWGRSPSAPKGQLFEQKFMNIDGEAGTTMRKFSTIADIEHLRYDVTNIAYAIRQGGSACIIGVGGGKDVQAAILFGHKKIVGIDINPIFIDLLKGRFRKFAGIADHPGVSLEVDEARSRLSRTKEKFDIIQMSLIDTWAATAAGAYSLSENSLYTIEAWKVFLSRLKDDGLFTLSRWYNPSDLGETGRVVSLATAVLLDLGIEDPSKNIVMVTTGNVSTVIISLKPYSEMDLATLKKAVRDLQFIPAIMPGEEPKNALLKDLIASKSIAALSKNAASESLNYEPPTDENPYFFNMLKFKTLLSSVRFPAGVIRGNLTASLTLIALIICLSFLTLLTVIIPLLFGSYNSKQQETDRKTFAAGALYFSMIGFGFMFIEIALIQRLSVYLGHPVYALGILLFTMILSTGIGSLVSPGLPLTRKPWVYLYPSVAVIAIIVLRFALSSIVSATITWGMLAKIFISILVIFPTGMILGMFFPTGMNLVKNKAAGQTPWFWALNGICGVLGSAVAVFISIYAGISFNFYLAAIFYGLLTASLPLLQRKTT